MNQARRWGSVKDIPLGVRVLNYNREEISQIALADQKGRPDWQLEAFDKAHAPYVELRVWSEMEDIPEGVSAIDGEGVLRDSYVLEYVHPGIGSPCYLGPFTEAHIRLGPSD